tara:strand:- start:199 stop:1020 length:822 start_codon:yes stop_codon:yes gene_type:complete
MSDYFSDKDDQSFEMPNDDPSAANTQPNPVQQPVDPVSGSDIDESGFGATEKATGSQQQDLMYMGIMALIIVVMLYILYSMFFAVTASDKEKIEPVKVEATPAPKPIVEAVKAPKPVENIVAKLDPKDRQQIDKQSVSINENQDKINEILEESQYMTTMVRKLGDAKNKIDKRFEDLESEIDRLAAVTEQAQEKIDALEKKLTEKTKPKVKEKPKMTYTLQAVVEGRAWIENNKGRSMTVKVGDVIEDYGVITKIDAVNSLVHCSSGKTIRVQ